MGVGHWNATLSNVYTKRDEPQNGLLHHFAPSYPHASQKNNIKKGSVSTTVILVSDMTYRDMVNFESWSPDPEIQTSTSTGQNFHRRKSCNPKICTSSVVKQNPGVTTLAEAHCVHIIRCSRKRLMHRSRIWMACFFRYYRQKSRLNLNNACEPVRMKGMRYKDGQQFAATTCLASDATKSCFFAEDCLPT